MSDNNDNDNDNGLIYTALFLLAVTLAMSLTPQWVLDGIFN